MILSVEGGVAPASCRLSRGRLALGAAGEDARRTAAGDGGATLIAATVQIARSRRQELFAAHLSV